jgi:electron transfer flavoprotein alpha subunit
MIVLVAEHSDGTLRKSTLELITVARHLAGKLEVEIAGLVVGSGVSAVAEELARFVPKVFLVQADELADTRAEPLTSVIAGACKELQAKVVLMGASRTGLSCSPRVAVRLDAPLLEDVTSLELEDDRVVATRFSYLSRVTETIRALSWPVVISVKPNLYPVAQPSAPGLVEQANPQLHETDLRVQVGEKRMGQGGRMALEEADIVVAGGRGVGSAEGFTTLVEPLADQLGAGIASTRAVVDAGWRPYAEQVGQTGKTVAPKLYLALGISGAVQHLSGMNRSTIVVAINKDADAPIFKVADYGIVGDVSAVVPELKAAIEELE